MNIRQLKQLLATAEERGLPDTTKIVEPGSDHDFRVVDLHIASALYDVYDNTWTEDHGEDVTPEADYGKRVKVLLVS